MAETCLLLVEGKNDNIVLSTLFEYHQIPQFKVKDKGGIDALLKDLPLELSDTELERLGIVIDADVDLDARWTALRGILVRSGGVNVPAAPNPDGTIFTVERPDRTLVVGVWMMPDNTLPGMLENFIGFLVPPGDALWPRAGECVAQIPDSERRFPRGRQSKAHVHTWLAWQEEPGAPLGQAITKRYLDAEAEHARRLIGCVRRLFDL